MQGGVRMGLTIGTALTLTIGDPFELSQTLRCEVVGVDSFIDGSDPETVLVRTGPSLNWRGREYAFLALRARRGPGLVQELELGQRVECSGLGVDPDTAEGSPPWGIDEWRGGLAVRATAAVECA